MPGRKLALELLISHQAFVESRLWLGRVVERGHVVERGVFRYGIYGGGGMQRLRPIYEKYVSRIRGHLDVQAILSIPHIAFTVYRRQGMRPAAPSS